MLKTFRLDHWESVAIQNSAGSKLGRDNCGYEKDVALVLQSSNSSDLSVLHKRGLYFVSKIWFELSKKHTFDLDTLSLLIEPLYLSSLQRVLQSPPNLHDLDTLLNGQRHGLVLQNGLGKLVSLQRKGILKPLPVLWLHLVADAQLVGQDHIVGPRDNVDRDLALGAGDLGAHIVAVGLRARAVYCLLVTCYEA